MTCDKCGSGMVTRIREPHLFAVDLYPYGSRCIECGNSEVWGEAEIKKEADDVTSRS